MTWYKDNVPITELNKEKSANFTITASGMELKVTPLTLLAEGNYKCVAKNKEGEVSKEGFLTINGMFRF